MIMSEAGGVRTYTPRKQVWRIRRLDSAMHTWLDVCTLPARRENWRGTPIKTAAQPRTFFVENVYTRIFFHAKFLDERGECKHQAIRLWKDLVEIFPKLRIFIHGSGKGDSTRPDPTREPTRPVRFQNLSNPLRGPGREP